MTIFDIVAALGADPVTREATNAVVAIATLVFACVTFAMFSLCLIGGHFGRALSWSITFAACALAFVVLA